MNNKSENQISLCGNNSPLTNSLLLAVTSEWDELTELNLELHNSPEVLFLDEIVAGVSHKNLYSLVKKMARGDDITEDPIRLELLRKSPFMHMRKLKSLKLWIAAKMEGKNCLPISDTSVDLLFAKMSSLEKLTLRNCSMISKACAKQYPSLEFST